MLTNVFTLSQSFQKTSLMHVSLLLLLISFHLLLQSLLFLLLLIVLMRRTILYGFPCLGRSKSDTWMEAEKTDKEMRGSEWLAWMQSAQWWRALRGEAREGGRSLRLRRPFWINAHRKYKEAALSAQSCGGETVRVRLGLLLWCERRVVKFFQKRRGRVWERRRGGGTDRRTDGEEACRSEEEEEKEEEKQSLLTEEVCMPSGPCAQVGPVCLCAAPQTLTSAAPVFTSLLSWRAKSRRTAAEPGRLEVASLNIIWPFFCPALSLVQPFWVHLNMRLPWGLSVCCMLWFAKFNVKWYGHHRCSANEEILFWSCCFLMCVCACVRARKCWHGIGKTMECVRLRPRSLCSISLFFFLPFFSSGFTHTHANARTHMHAHQLLQKTSWNFSPAGDNVRNVIITYLCLFYHCELFAKQKRKPDQAHARHLVRSRACARARYHSTLCGDGGWVEREERAVGG